MITAPVLITALPIITLQVLLIDITCMLECGALGLTLRWEVGARLAVKKTVARRAEQSGAPTKWANRASPAVLKLVLLVSPCPVILAGCLDGPPVRLVGTLNA